MARRIIRDGVLATVALLLAIQVIPYGRNHANPATRVEPSWTSPETRALAVRSCFDCHSNQTVWPWYSNIAPASWLLQRDVAEGRSSLNFSEWNRPQEGPGDSVEKVIEGSMPPSLYALVRSKARLSATERQALVLGLGATFGTGGAEGGGHDKD